VEATEMQPGSIYVASPDLHLVVEDGLVRSAMGPRENLARPSIDVLFRSAAQAYGPAAIGVVLTGTLGDGAAGLWSIAQHGGTCIVQDPNDALHPEMPLNALNAVRVQHCLPLDEIAPLLVQLGAQAERRGGWQPHALVDPEQARESDLWSPQPAGLACPSCRGALSELPRGRLLRYRCHIGHAFTPQSLILAQELETERLLEGALSLMEERADLLRRVAERYFADRPDERERYERRIEGLDERADSLRRVIATDAREQAAAAVSPPNGGSARGSAATRRDRRA